MNILVFTSLYPNNIWTHHGVFIKERITHCARQGTCQIKVVAPVPYYPPLKLGQRAQYAEVVDHEVIEDVEVYHPRYVMIPKISMGLHGVLMFLSALACVTKLRRRFDFDLIDAHYVYPDGFAAVLLGAFFGKPVVVSARGSDINLFASFPLIRRFLQYTLRRATRVVAVSQALKERICQLDIPEAKVAVIPNGVDLQKFTPIPQDEARRHLGLPARTTLLSVGHLTANKGFDLLLKALHRLVQEPQYKHLYLVIVGEGPCRRELEELITALHLASHVRLVGDMPHHALATWYSAADLFCLASAREGWPNVLLEALACGTPVVATAVGGIPEIIRSDEVGILTGRDEQALADSIALALTKPWHSSTIITYAAEHTWERVSQDVLHVFEAVLSGGSPEPPPAGTAHARRLSGR